MNEDEMIKEMQRRSKEKGLPLSDEMIVAELKRIAKETEGLSLEDSIRKLAKMLKEDSKHE